MLPIKNDAIVLGLLIGILALVFHTAGSKDKFWKSFYRFVPPVLLCYFLPALLNWPLGIVDPAESKLYYMASRYLLPAALIWLCLSIDLKGIINLGPKALIMFFAATVGIIIGGPIAILLMNSLFPSLLDIPADQLWKGMSTIAGSWIGGGANQTAMKEIFGVDDNTFASMILVDVTVANIWLGFLLFGASISPRIDKWLKADTSSIESLKERISTYKSSVQRMPTTLDYYYILLVGLGGTALSHLVAEIMVPFLEQFRPSLEAARLNSLLSPFFWLVITATTIGVGFSFTKIKKLEGVGASSWGSICIYILVATIGMKMDLSTVLENLNLFALGFIWILVHVVILLIVAKLIKAPLFYVAVGSQANVGGAASAPIVASAFHPSLASVGVLMAVLGYALGTYGAIICAYIMQWAATG